MFDRRLFLLLIISLFLCGSLMAQETEPFTQLDEAKKPLDLAAQALVDIQRDIEVSQQQLDEIAQEIAALQKDQATLSEALVGSAARTRQLDEALRGRGERLAGLLAQKAMTQDGMATRSREIGATLALMERMGLRPPPAILAHPNDSVRALRASSLLKALMQDLTQRMQNLQTDLSKIEEIEDLINAEKAQIEAQWQQVQLEKQRLQGLLEEKKIIYDQSHRQLIALQDTHTALAQKAQSLTDLVADLEVLPTPKEKGEDENSLVPIDGDFAHQRGRLKLPVKGVKMQVFEKDGQGDYQGELYETALDALITTPVDAVVRYAGSFRSYGQLLILDVGQNHHLVLAGMGQLYVQQGQVLLAGEPVGTMGTSQQQGMPMLYIELRKEGIPIDPAPWWGRPS